MIKFQIGDRVKVLKDDGTSDDVSGGYRKGQILYIVDIINGYVPIIRTSEYLHGKASNGWTANNFELYKSRKLKLKLP